MHNQRIQNKVLAWFLLGLLSCIWGSSYILIKKSLQVFSSEEIVTLRILIGGIFLLPFSLVQLHKLGYKQYKLLLLSGCMGIFLPVFLVAKAQIKISSSVNGALGSLTPVFTLLVGMLFFRRKITKHEVLGASLGIIGSILLVLLESAGTMGKINFYAILPILACFLYGANINFTKFYLQDLAAKTITSVSLLIVGIIAGIILFTQTNFLAKLYTVQGAYQAVGYVAILGTLGMGVAQLLFSYLIKVAPPLFASSVSFLLPIVALIWGLGDQEILSWKHYLSIILILLGMYFVNQYPAPKETN